MVARLYSTVPELQKVPPILKDPKENCLQVFVPIFQTWKGSSQNSPTRRLQVTDFVDAVKNRKKFALNEENGHRSRTIINIGKIALQLGRNLKFDPVKQEFINDEGANRLLNPPLRGPWFI